MYNKTILPNGLKIVTHEMKDRESVSLGIWFNTGGRYEEDRIKGAAHFLEHMVFKGSKKYECERIKQIIEGVGGSLNAFTAEEQTCFYAKIPIAFVKDTFDVLADMTFFPLIQPKDIEKEKTVIIEEIKMYHDLPQYQVIDYLDSLLWPEHPLGKNIAGTIESVSSMDKKVLTDFHRTFFNSSNAAVVACGRIKHDTLVQLVKKKLGQCRPWDRQSFVKANNTQQNPRVKFHKKDIEQMHLAMGMLGYDQYQQKRYVLSLLSVILGGNMSSRLFVEVREKHGLAYSISSYSKAMADTGVFMVRAGVDNQRLVQAVDLILKVLEKISSKAVEQAEFNRARDYIIGQLVLGLEDTMEYMVWMGESLMARDRIRTVKEIIAEYKKITPADVRRIAKEVLDPRRFNLALVGPLTDEQQLEINLRLGIS